MQSELLARLHEPHQETIKTKLRARTSVFWRELNKDIDNNTKACQVCQELQDSQQKEPTIQTEIPTRPWHTIAADLRVYFAGDEYVLITDYYSKFPFVRKIPKGHSISRTVIDILKQVLSEHGVSFR